MLAFPTPTFDAKTILQAPGFRPTGKSSGLVYAEQPEAVTAPSLVNRHTSNGFVGTRAKTFIQNNQFNTSEMKFDPTKGIPLSVPGSVGNVDTQAIGVSPKYAEPENGELKAILNILNGKPSVGEVEKLSAKQLASLEKKGKGPVAVDGARRVVEDFSDAREAMRKQTLIQKAIRQGFSKEEAEEAYKKIRVREAEITLGKDEDPSVRLYDLIDSKVSGTQNGSYRSNDETGLFLAKGGNAVMVKQAQRRSEKYDKNAGVEVPVKTTQPTPKFDAMADLINRFKALPKAGPQLLLEDKKPKLEITELGMKVLSTAAGIEKIPKQRGRKPGSKDTYARVRRTNEQIAASLKNLPILSAALGLPVGKKNEQIAAEQVSLTPAQMLTKQVDEILKREAEREARKIKIGKK